MPRHALGLSFIILLCTLPASGRAASLNVASNGTDSGACGPKEDPCRSISQAITNAAPDDKIIS